MRSDSGPIWDVWTQGGPFVGPTGKQHGRVTVELGWTLQESSGPVGSRPASKLPVRWFQRADNSQVETEVPNVKTIHITRSIDTDADQLTLVIQNQNMDDPAAGELGHPGFYSFGRGAEAEAVARWGHEPNEWAGVIAPNALIRTYEGYGGFNPSTFQPLGIDECLLDGSLEQTGVWLVDTVVISTSGIITITCRDMRKLLIDEQIYPPYVRTQADGGVYPLHYARFFHRVIRTPTILYGTAAGGSRYCLGIESDAGSNGYWVSGDDGGVFTYGDNNFFGSLGNEFDHSICGIAITPTQNGYWIATNTGLVFRFGDANDHGGHAPAGGQLIVAIESTAAYDGYWLCDTAGHVYSLGAAPYHGGTPGAPHPIVAMAARPNGAGYWLLDDHGEVYAYGTSSYLGAPTYIGNQFTAIASTPSGNGYYIVDVEGHVYVFGDAVDHGGTGGIVLNDPISDIAVAPNGLGYWLVALDGGVFTFGDVLFYGSLPGAGVGDYPYDGNYSDYAGIIKDLILWAGFWLYDGGVADLPLSSIQTTGAYAQNDLPDDLFDKKPPMDVITKIKEIVGYITWCDYDGAFHFECVDEETEALTTHGWARHCDIFPGDQILAFDRETGTSYWETVEKINRYEVANEEMVSLESRSHSSLTTQNHRWWVTSPGGKGSGRWRLSGDLKYDDCIPIAAPHQGPLEAAYDDAFVELIGWWVTEGHHSDNASSYICQSHTANAEKCERIHACFEKLYGPQGRRRGAGWNRKCFPSRAQDYCWTFGRAIRDELAAAAPRRVLSMGFLLALTTSQLRLLVDTCMAGDGHKQMVGTFGPYGRYFQKDLEAVRSLEIACVLAGIAPRTTDMGRGYRTSYLNSKRVKPIGASRTTGGSAKATRRPYTGTVWCPSLPKNHVWMARRNGTVFFTGNSPNWWNPGNYLPDGSHTDFVPQIDEIFNLNEYGISTDDKAVRSEIIISSDQPTDDIDGTITTSVTPPSAAALRGIPKPALWVNEAFISEDQQRLMAEFIAVQIWFTQRLGSASGPANPHLQVNDQVQVWERQTDEVYYHYVRSIETTHDLETGQYDMKITTHWLGKPGAWAVDMPT